MEHETARTCNVERNKKQYARSKSNGTRKRTHVQSRTDHETAHTSTVEWNVNSTGWQTTPMELTASGIAYTSAIPSPVVTGDQLQYRIIASDASGLQAVNGIYTVDIRYPVMSLSPTNFGTSFLPSTFQKILWHQSSPSK